jgi:lipid A 3-O-deacylase
MRARVKSKRAGIVLWAAGLLAGAAAMGGRPLQAQAVPQEAVAPARPLTIQGVNVSVGRFGIFRGQEDPEIGGEVHFAPRRFRFQPRFLPEVTPVLGGAVTGEGSFYGYFGFRTDIPMDGRWVFTPFCGAGLYYFGGGRDLGGVLELRTGFEIAYQLEKDERIGLSLYHLSNAGLYQRNPGSESLVLSYTRLFRKR